MASNQQPGSDLETLYALQSKPGVRRDGTATDNDYFSDGVWVRWQRGRVRKMGGYRAMSTQLNGPIRSVLIDSRNGVNSGHYFSQYGIQRQQFSLGGVPNAVNDRTPVGYYANQGNPLLTWSHGVMTSSTGGSFSALIAASSPDLNDLTSDVGGGVFQGDIAGIAPLVPMSGPSGLLSVSGGVCVLQPFAVLYGSSGLLYNSDANDLSQAGWTPGTGFVNQANVAGTKFIHGAPVRGGSQSPAGLFWALDALVRMSFDTTVSTFWRYDTLSQPTSIMGKKTVVEHDGKFFWVGTDRFLFYNGVVQELPNQMNCNWFFDNLNYSMRNKVWGTKIPRFGEIWWFYPRGTATECTDAIIFNYNENTWYDAHLARSAGGLVQIFQYPMWAGDEDVTKTINITIGVQQALTSALTSGTATVVVASTTGILAGYLVSSTVAGLPVGVTVSSVTNGTTLVLSANATATLPIGSVLIFSSMTTPIGQGYTVTGATSGTVGNVFRSGALSLNVTGVSGSFTTGEVINGTPSGVARNITAFPPFSQDQDAVYQQEFGLDKVVGSNIDAIQASFTTTQFGFSLGSPFVQTDTSVDVMTFIGRFEFDFAQIGDIVVSVFGNSYPQQDPVLLQTITKEQEDFYADFNVQERIIQIKVESNVAGGWFEQGQALVNLRPGDVRSTKAPERD